MRRLLEQYQDNAFTRSIARNYNKMPLPLKAWFVITHCANKYKAILTVIAGMTALCVFWNIRENTWMDGGTGLLSDSTLWPYFYSASALVIILHEILPAICNFIFYTWFDAVKTKRK